MPQGAAYQAPIHPYSLNPGREADPAYTLKLLRDLGEGQGLGFVIRTQEVEPVYILGVSRMANPAGPVMHLLSTQGDATEVKDVMVARLLRGTRAP